MDYSNITELDLFNKGLTKLPDLSIYINLKKLYCSNNKLTSLDNLPQTIAVLVCSHNRITRLDNLPQTITYLDCYNNPFIYVFNPTLENIRNHKNT